MNNPDNKTEHNAMNDKEERDIRTAKIAYEYAWEKYKMQHQFFDSINTKNSIVISLITLLLTVITGFIAYLYQDYVDKGININCIHHLFIIVLLGTVVLVVISLWESLGILNTKSMLDAMETEKIIDFLKSHKEKKPTDEKILYADMALSLGAAEKSVIEVNSKEATQFARIIIYIKVIIILIIIDISLFVLIKFLNQV